MFIDDAATLADLASGAAFLGSGGGGDPYYSLLLAEAALARCGRFEVVSLADVADDALLAPCGWIGAPTVSVEKLPNGNEAVSGLKRLEEIMGKPIDAVLPIEIGGGNVASGEYSVTGSGSIDAEKLAAQTINASIAGSGDIDAQATGKADINILGSGDANISGGANCTTRAMGSGTATCR
ncbi:MAG: DUF917 family protein [Sphingopyxis sp.]|nr:DUF917 family protein [Sphingopyxis sp.]